MCVFLVKGGDILSIPLSPTGLSPNSGQEIPISQSNIFSWSTDSNQSQYYLEYSRNIASATVYNTGWISSSTASHTFLPSVFTNTYSYKWRIKIRNNLSQESPYSLWAVFIAGNSKILDIIYPAIDFDVVTSLPVYSHSFTPLGNQTQASFQYLVYTATSWGTIGSLTPAQQEAETWGNLELYNSTLIWDSGEITSTETSIQQPPGYMITGTYWYKVRCIVTDNMGNVYTSDLRTFYILLDSIPQIPIIIADDDPDEGKNIITITNPTPDAGQIATDYNRLYRKNIDNTWELIQDNISGLASPAYSLAMQPVASLGTYEIGYDTTCHSSKQEEYAVSAVGVNGIESSKSASAYATCSLEDYWFTNLTTNTTIKLTMEPEWSRMQSEREREEYQPMDEIYPTILYGQRRFYRGQFQALVMNPDNIRWPVYIAQIRAILDVGNSVLMRTPWGDLFELDIYNLNITPFERPDRARTISFNMVEISEIVSADTFTYDAPTSQLDGYWVLDPLTNRGIRLWIEQEWDGFTSERDRSEIIGLTSEFPSIGYSNKKAMRGGFSGYLMPIAGELLCETVMKLRSLIDAKNKKPLIFETMSGDRLMVDIYGFSFELVNRSNHARKISFEFIEIGEI